MNFCRRKRNCEILISLIGQSYKLPLRNQRKKMLFGIQHEKPSQKKGFKVNFIKGLTETQRVKGKILLLKPLMQLCLGQSSCCLAVYLVVGLLGFIAPPTQQLLDGVFHL